MTFHSHGHHNSIAELLDLDLGAGTGTGTVALANHFTSADVVAVDMSAEMLHRIWDRAAVGGLAGQVSTVQMNLDGPWPSWARSTSSGHPRHSTSLPTRPHHA
jgi:methylase of polypeptide subunit release factors